MTPYVSGWSSAYDGSGFHGFARQPGQRTVAGELARAISKFCRHHVDLVCAGQTDTGVHAHGQVVHTEVSPTVDLEDLKRSINRQLAPAVVVRSLDLAPPGFDARHSALSRSYRYLVFQATEADPLLSGVAWHVAENLDLKMMRAARTGSSASTTSALSAGAHRATRKEAHNEAGHRRRLEHRLLSERRARGFRAACCVSTSRRLRSAIR